MIHYSCDRCRRLIETEDDLRYVVRLEIQAKFGVDEDTDDLPEELLERQEDVNDPFIDEETFSRRRFDLCNECYREYIRNPLGRESTKSVGFSDN